MGADVASFQLLEVEKILLPGNDRFTVPEPDEHFFYFVDETSGIAWVCISAFDGMNGGRKEISRINARYIERIVWK